MTGIACIPFQRSWAGWHLFPSLAGGILHYEAL